MNANLIFMAFGAAFLLFLLGVVTESFNKLGARKLCRRGRGGPQVK